MNPILSRIREVPHRPAFEMDGFWVWCPSVVVGDDGLFHLFASRWPKHLPMHPGWMVASEAVHAVSDSPLGPFVFDRVVLGERGAEWWDGRSVHNPRVMRHGAKWIMTYMGSTHPFENPGPGEAFPLTDPRCIVARSNKRVGLATADRPEGPWTRLDAPILPTRPGTFYSFLTSNPSLIIRDDDSALLVFKSRAYAPLKHGDQMIGLATAPHWTGPYAVKGNEAFFGKDRFGEIEDPFFWKDAQGFHMIAKDMHDTLAGEHHAGILAHSPDGERWTLDPSPKAYSRRLRFDDGSEATLGQMERPFGLQRGEELSHLYFAAMDGAGGFHNGTKSWIQAVPLA